MPAKGADHKPQGYAGHVGHGQHEHGMSHKHHPYGLTPAGHLIVQGSIPLTLVLLGTILAVTTNPARRTIRLLHNVAAGIMLAEVSERLFPDMVHISLEGPANKLGTAVGFMLAAFTSVLVYEQRETTANPTAKEKSDATLFRAHVEACVTGFLAGSVLFDSRLDKISVPYMLALGLGIKTLLNTIVAVKEVDEENARSVEAEFSQGTAQMCEIASFFAISMVIVPVTARSLRPVYAMIMAFVATQCVSLSINDILSSSADEPNLGLSLRDYSEALMFFVGEALVLSARWITSTANTNRKLAMRHRIKKLHHD
jgi:zinc transporter ZupT